MKANDLFKFALSGLKRRAARTFLTVLGVIIGTACIVLMFAVGLSNYRQFEQSLQDQTSLTEITINDYSNSGSLSSGITDSTIQTISSIDHVKAVSPVLNVPVVLTAGKYTANIGLQAVDLSLIDAKLSKGSMPQTGGIPSILLGGQMVQYFVDPENPPNYNDYEAMERYSPDIDLLGTEMEMRLGYETEDSEVPQSAVYRAVVAGITERSYSEQSYNAYIDINAAKQLLMENRDLAAWLNINLSSYNTVKVQVDEMDNVESVLKEVRKLGYETYSATESITQWQEELSRQQGQLFAIGIISLLVSAIGIANTMYANILERRRDIGVMKVVGMKIRKIRQLFITESAIIGLLGGLVGIAISYIAVLIINTGTEETSFLGMYFSEGMKISIPLWLALIALAIAVGVGVLSGIYPARKATKMSPLEAMRN